MLLTRRTFLPFTLSWSLARAAVAKVRGRLLQSIPDSTALRTAGGAVVALEGDAATQAVLRDKRLAQDDFEAEGEIIGSNRFRIRPIHERGMFVYRNGARLVITYWCPVCAIRAYSPGKCVCCQEETDLDPRDPSLKDEDPTPAKL